MSLPLPCQFEIEQLLCMHHDMHALALACLLGLKGDFEKA